MQLPCLNSKDKRANGHLLKMLYAMLVFLEKENVMSDHPWVNVAFTKNEDKDTFNRIEPTRDRELFAQKFTDLLISFGRSP
jgi:hypothetical protein